MLIPLALDSQSNSPLLTELDELSSSRVYRHSVPDATTES